jgi:hypothetical protein
MNRVLAAAIAALLLLSLLRTRGAEPAPAGGDAAPAATVASSGSTPPTATTASSGASLRLEVQAEVPFGGVGPPLSLRVRARDGASRPFDVAAREEKTRQQFTWEIGLPVKEPELPLRVALVGDEWCQPPGVVEIEVPRLESPWKVVLMRARPLDAQVVDERGGAPLARVELVHASGRLLATTGLDGRARLSRPRAPQKLGATRVGDLVVARAVGFLPGALDESSSAPLPLRASEKAGRLDGRVLDPDGAPVAGATIQPCFEPRAPEPDDAAGRAIHRLLAASGGSGVPALSTTSDEDGRFTLPLPLPGAVTVTASRRDLGRTSEALRDERLAEPGRVTTIELRFPARIELRARARSGGRPLADVSLELVAVERAANGDVGTPTTLDAALTDPNGRATLRGPAAAPLWLLARAEKLAPKLVEVAPDGRRELDLEIELDPGRAVTFTLRGAASLPPEQRLVAWRDVASGVSLGERPLELDGTEARARLEHLPIGRRVELRLPLAGGGAGVRLAEFEVERAADGAAPADLDLGALELPGGP